MVYLSHYILRKLLSDYGGASIQWTEMLNPHKVVLEDFDSSPWIKKTDTPTIYQLAINEMDISKKAIQKLLDYNIYGIDINMGCHAPSARKTKTGVHLMKDIDSTCAIFDSIRKYYFGLLTAKIRIGFEEDINQTIQIVKKLENSGIDALIFHPRLFNQKLKSIAKWNYILELKNHIKIPIIGNGDIESAKQAIEYLDLYKCDGIMLGRLSVTKPWVFAEIDSMINNKIFIEPDKCSLLINFINLCFEYFESKDSMMRIKRFVFYFSQNYQFGHVLWTKINNANNKQEMIDVVNNFLKPIHS